MTKKQNKTNLLINTPEGRRPLTDLEKCMLLILRKENNISTARVLSIAKTLQICASCSDRSEVFYVGERLIKKNLIIRKFTNKSYYWSLAKKGYLCAKQI